MKFTYYMKRHMVPAWIKLYLNYKLLKTSLQVSTKVKDLLVMAKKTKSGREYRVIKRKVMDSRQLMDKLTHDNKQFVQNFNEEFIKLENFISWKYTDLKQKMSKIQQQIKIMRIIREEIEILYLTLRKSRSWHQVFTEKEPESYKDGQLRLKRNQKKLREQTQQLLETCYRFYQETLHFQSYVEVNSEAIRKILKKYKKKMIKGIRNQRDDKRNFGDILNKLNLNTITNKVKLLLFDIEEMMVSNFYQQNPAACRRNLRRYKEEKKIRKTNVFMFGFFAGYVLVFLLFLMFERFQGAIDPNGDKVFNKVFPCFRGMILFLVYYWYLALDVVGWNYFGINYKVYLGFNHHFSTATEIIKRVSVLSTIFLVVFILYLMQVEQISQLTTSIQFFDPRYLPIILWLVGAFYVFVPTQKRLNGEGRLWMFRTAWGALFGHFIKYESRFTFFTDQFVSMVTPFRDLDYTLCYYYHWARYHVEQNTECNYQYRLSAMLPSVIPYSLKCIQYITRARDKGKFWNTDEMWNFFKTALAVQVGWLSFLAKQVPAARVVWIPVAICSSCWQYWWDLKKDWLFFEPNARHKFLRDDLGYNSPAIYYIIAVLNLFLRATWALSISPNMYVYLGIRSELFGLCVGFLEMTRRFMNNFLKIEKEHITNLNALKTVSDYKYPFDTKFLNKATEREINEEMSRWSVSTLNRHSQYIQDVSAVAPEKVKSAIQQLTDSEKLLIGRSLSIDHLRKSASGHTPKITLTYSTQRAIDRSNLNDIVSKRDSDSFNDMANFRLTEIVSPFEQLKHKNSSQTIVENPDMDVINTAKKQEKFAENRTKEIKIDNKKYFGIIESLFDLHQVAKE